jgi:hypothetical protein
MLRFGGTRSGIPTLVNGPFILSSDGRTQGGGWIASVASVIFPSEGRRKYNVLDAQM